MDDKFKLEALKKTCPYDFDLEFVFIYEDADKCKYSEVCERIFSMVKQEGEIDGNEIKIKIPTRVLKQLYWMLMKNKW